MSTENQGGKHGKRRIDPLGQPLRRRILRELLRNEGARRENQVASQLGVPLSRTAYHLRVLAGPGLVREVGTSSDTSQLSYEAAVTGDPEILELLERTEADDEFRSAA